MTEFTKSDLKFMGVALSVARRGLGRTSPNPSVGAVLVQKIPSTNQRTAREIIIARGRTGDKGTPHAEVAAIQAAKDLPEATTLYVTLEPCNHQGQNPPCTAAIIEAGIEEVIIGAIDPDSRVSGSGIEKLKSAGIKVRRGCRRQEANQLLAGHISVKQNNRPYIVGKIAVGANELVAPGLVKPGSSHPVWVTGEIARNRGHLMRAEADAIIVGWKTAEIDEPSLNCRLPGIEELNPAANPRPVILDTNLSLNPENKLLQKNQTPKSLIVTGPNQIPAKVSGLQYQGVDVVELTKDNQGGIDLEKLVQHLAENGVQRVLVEGGPTLLTRFLEQNLIDELAIFKGATKVRENAIPPFGDHKLSWPEEELGFRLSRSQKLLDDMLYIYKKFDEM